MKTEPFLFVFQDELRLLQQLKFLKKDNLPTFPSGGTLLHLRAKPQTFGWKLLCRIHHHLLGTTYLHEHVHALGKAGFVQSLNGILAEDIHLTQLLAA